MVIYLRMSLKKADDEVLKATPTLNKCLESSVKQDLRMRRGNIKDSNLNKTQQKRISQLIQGDTNV